VKSSAQCSLKMVSDLNAPRDLLSVSEDSIESAPQPALGTHPASIWRLQPANCFRIAARLGANMLSTPVSVAMCSQCLSILAGRTVTASDHTMPNLMEAALEAVRDPAASALRTSADRLTLGRVRA